MPEIGLGCWGTEGRCPKVRATQCERQDRVSARVGPSDSVVSRERWTCCHCMPPVYLRPGHLRALTGIALTVAIGVRTLRHLLHHPRLAQMPIRPHCPHPPRRWPAAVQLLLTCLLVSLMQALAVCEGGCGQANVICVTCVTCATVHAVQCAPYRPIDVALLHSLHRGPLAVAWSTLHTDGTQLCILQPPPVTSSLSSLNHHTCIHAIQHARTRPH